MLRDSVVVVVAAVVRTRPRAISLAMYVSIHTHLHDNHEKINSRVSFSFLYEYGAPLGGSSSHRSSANKLSYACRFACIPKVDGRKELKL